MPRDLFDKVFWILLLITAVALAAILLSHSSSTVAARGGSIDKAMERELIARSRMALLQKLYGPVEQLRTVGQHQGALLKLEEVERSYPTEAHGMILRGEILLQMGAFDAAVASFARGVELNGEYVDERSPLSRREQIEAVVKKGVANTKSTSLGSGKELQKNLFYLQSRLAGGCE